MNLVADVCDGTYHKDTKAQNNFRFFVAFSPGGENGFSPLLLPLNYEGSSPTVREGVEHRAQTPSLTVGLLPRSTTEKIDAINEVRIDPARRMSSAPVLI